MGVALARVAASGRCPACSDRVSNRMYLDLANFRSYLLFSLVNHAPVAFWLPSAVQFYFESILWIESGVGFNPYRSVGSKAHDVLDVKKPVINCANIVPTWHAYLVVKHPSRNSRGGTRPTSYWCSSWNIDWGRFGLLNHFVTWGWENRMSWLLYKQSGLTCLPACNASGTDTLSPYKNGL